MKIRTVAWLGLAVWAAPATAAVIADETQISVQTSEEAVFQTGDGTSLYRLLETGDTAASAQSDAGIDGETNAAYYGYGFGYGQSNGFLALVLDGVPGRRRHVVLNVDGYANVGGNGSAAVSYSLSQFSPSSVLLWTRSFYGALCAACAAAEYGIDANNRWQLDADPGDKLVFQFYAVAQQDSADGGFGYANSRLYHVLTVTGVPEPASWAMMLAGFGALGAAARRRRAVHRVTA